MHGSTFRTSDEDRARRRADGPVLSLVVGNADHAPARSRVVHRAHPGFEGFTPDDTLSYRLRPVVQDSGPESVSDRRSSRGSTSPDVGGPTRSGPGPHASQADLVQRIADYLVDYDARRAASDATIVPLHRKGNASG